MCVLARFNADILRAVGIADTVGLLLSFVSEEETFWIIHEMLKRFIFTFEIVFLPLIAHIISLSLSLFLSFFCSSSLFSQKGQNQIVGIFN